MKFQLSPQCSKAIIEPLLVKIFNIANVPKGSTDAHFFIPTVVATAVLGMSWIVVRLQDHPCPPARLSPPPPPPRTLARRDKSYMFRCSLSNDCPGRVARPASNSPSIAPRPSTLSPATAAAAAARAVGPTSPGDFDSDHGGLAGKKGEAGRIGALLRFAFLGGGTGFAGGVIGVVGIVGSGGVGSVGVSVGVSAYQYNPITQYCTGRGHRVGCLILFYWWW